MEEAEPLPSQVGPKDRCPCRSGKKYKKCCGALELATSGLPHTQADRASVFEKVDLLVDELWEEEEEFAFEEFWGRHLDREGELPPDLLVVSRDAEETWFAFDRRLETGTRIVDELLAKAAWSRGERAFLTANRQSSMRLFEVADTVPGTSMTLRDLVEGTVVTVSERAASRTIPRHACIAARVISRGCSGRPEMERGVLPIISPLRDRLLADVRARRAEFLREHAGAPIDDFYKLLPPLFHDAWITSIFEPPIPELANTDGEAMVATRVSFHVDDEGALRGALDGGAHDGLSRSGDAEWGWAGNNAKGGEVSLGTVLYRDGTLTLETNSVERGARGRDLLERLVGAAIRHRGTTHQDLRRMVTERLVARALGRPSADDVKRPEPLEPHVAEALVAQHYGRHYRTWIDEPVPALDGRTPRQAAKSRALRSRLDDLIHGLEGMYERALKDGQPAYDPSWMWAELGLEPEPGARDLPALAHERVAERVPGCADAIRTAADRFRAMPGFSATETTLDEDDLRTDLDLQRFLRRDRASANDVGQGGVAAAPYLPLMVNLELHRRKVFWVDAALSYMLDSTDVAVACGALRAPFPSFAIAFTDRHTLSLGERLLSRQADDPLRGQILRVVTVYVTERRSATRTLSVVFAFDALGADLPSLVRFEVPADDEPSVLAFLESVAPRPLAVPDVPDASPTRGLLRIVLNAVLYSTSAGVTPEVRTRAPQKRSASSTRSPPESDSVFFLPGKIDIRGVRQLQELRRAPGGAEALARFMVRGHWRRPAKNWEDQRPRWIEPYWKGPDLAAVIEKAYRLVP